MSTEWKEITITKDIMLEAVRREPLIAGSWIHPRKRTSKGVCKVCAVGGILRRSGVVDQDISTVATMLTIPISTSIYSHPNELIDMVREGRALNAISCYFEKSMYRGLSLPVVRRRLLSWIEKNIPDEFTQTVRIPGSSM